MTLWKIMMFGGNDAIGNRGTRRRRKRNETTTIKEVPMRRLQWMAVCALALLLFSAMPVSAFEIGKVIRVHLDRNDVYLDSEFSGPYVALTVSF
jgi:hypothetical protein